MDKQCDCVMANSYVKENSRWSLTWIRRRILKTHKTLVMHTFKILKLQNIYESFALNLSLVQTRQVRWFQQTGLCFQTLVSKDGSPLDSIDLMNQWTSVQDLNLKWICKFLENVQLVWKKCNYISLGWVFVAFTTFWPVGAASLWCLKHFEMSIIFQSNC